MPEDISPARPPGGADTRSGDVPINTDEQPAGPESGPLQSVDERQAREEADKPLKPPPQPEDNDV